MATNDNKIWLLKNIRDAFIASDDTGLCEIVMGGEDLSKIFIEKGNQKKSKLKEERLNKPTTSKESPGETSGEDEKEIVTEFDAYPDMEDSEEEDLICGSYMRYDELGSHRQRSNAAQWLDKKEQALKKAAKTKVVKWDDSCTQPSSEVIAETFDKKEILKPSNKKSLLTDQIEKCPDLPHLKYLEFAKFDGTEQMSMPTKTFKIYMTVLPEKHHKFPLVVTVIASAKIKDLIGFICYKYSIEHPEAALGSVHDLGICIAEDDGEVDWGFPCLEANEPCSKFGFTCLGLVDLKYKNSLTQATSSIPEDAGLSGAFQMVFPKGTDSVNQNPSRHNTGGGSTSEAVKFALQSMNEGRKSGEANMDRMQSHIIATEAPQYKAYQVQLLRKVRANTAVRLGISLDRIEIEPLVPHKHAFWGRSKYFLHSIDSIAWCQILEAKANRTTFRIVYSPSDSSRDNEGSGSSFLHPSSSFKYHDFECDHDIAKEIVDKVNTILDLRNSPCRREYKNAKIKKWSHNAKHFS